MSQLLLFLLYIGTVTASQITTPYSKENVITTPNSAFNGPRDIKLGKPATTSNHDAVTTIITSPTHETLLNNLIGKLASTIAKSTENIGQELINKNLIISQAATEASTESTEEAEQEVKNTEELNVINKLSPGNTSAKPLNPNKQDLESRSTTVITQAKSPAVDQVYTDTLSNKAEMTTSNPVRTTESLRKGHGDKDTINFSSGQLTDDPKLETTEPLDQNITVKEDHSMKIYEHVHTECTGCNLQLTTQVYTTSANTIDGSYKSNQTKAPRKETTLEQNSYTITPTDVTTSRSHPTIINKIDPSIIPSPIITTQIPYTTLEDLYLSEQPVSNNNNNNNLFGNTSVGATLATILSSVNSSGALWPVKHSAVVEGDIVLGGLMMVHEREDSVTCGPVMPQGGIQALEAMLYTLDRINADPFILPNITLGAHILDDCDKDTYGLEMAVDFIKGEFHILTDYSNQLI